MIRALYYVTAVNVEQPDQRDDAPSYVKVHLTPAYSQKKDSEKASFWQASPGGKACFAQTPTCFPDAKTGQFYYLDFERVDAREEGQLIMWLQEKRIIGIGDFTSKTSPLQEHVKLHTDWREGNFSSFEVFIDNPKAQGYFEHGVPYKVTITSAAPS